MSKLWLVTCSASGLGRDIAEAISSSGDRLVATARDPDRLEDLAKKHGNRVRTAVLDVADEAAANAAAQVMTNPISLTWRRGLPSVITRNKTRTCVFS